MSASGAALAASSADFDVHVSSYPWASALHFKSKAARRMMLLRCRDVYPVSVYVLAAVEIQRVWRGILLRRRVLAKYMGQGFVRPWCRLAARVAAAYRVVPRAPEAQFVVLARRVQARWRASLLHGEFARWVQHRTWAVYYVAAATIQRAWIDARYRRTRRTHRRRGRRLFLTKQDAAAGAIQSLWRGFVSRSVFRFYVQLIRFRERGDPAVMLRAINPNESGLVDPAAGLHVRFRLGGAVFPPTVYYRIYTHASVADIGSFAPKDYTRERQQRVAGAARHNRPAPTAGLSASAAAALAAKRREAEQRRFWYRRVENNPWRPIAAMVLRDAGGGVSAAPGATGATPSPVSAGHAAASAGPFASALVGASQSSRDVIPRDAPFHYSRLKRREARAAKDKQTRRRWLAEMYAAEQADLLKNTTVPVERVREEAAALFASLTEQEVDEEVARLCAWTHHLDFASYRADWQLIATTAPSNAAAASRAGAGTRPAQSYAL